MRSSVSLKTTIDNAALQLTCDNSVNAFGFGGLSIGKYLSRHVRAPTADTATGQAWSDYVPALNKEQAFAFLDAWWKAGGVHIDTSNHYQVSSSASA